MPVNCPIRWPHPKRRSLRNPQRPVILWRHPMVASRSCPVVRADRVIQPEVAAGLMTLVPAARDQRLGNRSAAALAWRLLKGKVTRRGTEGEPEPGSGRRERTGERRTGGPGEGGRRGRTRRANGKPEESPPRETGGREVRPQTSRARARGSGAARIYGGARSQRRCANFAWPPASFLAGHAVWQSNPDTTLP